MVQEGAQVVVDSQDALRDKRPIMGAVILRSPASYQCVPKLIYIAAKVKISVHGAETVYVLNASSRSRTDLSSLIRIVVRLGYASVGVLCAVTRAG